MDAVKAFLAEGLSRRDFLAATFSPGLSRREGFSRRDFLAVRAFSRRVQAFLATTSMKLSYFVADCDVAENEVIRVIKLIACPRNIDPRCRTVYVSAVISNLTYETNRCPERLPNHVLFRRPFSE